MFKRKKWYQKALTPASSIATLIVGGTAVGLTALVYDGYEARKTKREELVKDTIRNEIRPLRDNIERSNATARAIGCNLENAIKNKKCDCQKSKD